MNKKKIKLKHLNNLFLKKILYVLLYSWREPDLSVVHVDKYVFAQ